MILNGGGFKPEKPWLSVTPTYYLPDQSGHSPRPLPVRDLPVDQKFYLLGVRGTLWYFKSKSRVPICLRSNSAIKNTKFV